MNKRKSKKAYYKFINGTQRFGCEYCCGMTNIFFHTDGGWLNVSLGINKKEKKFTINQDHKPIGYINARYCWNCGKKFK